LQKGVNIRHSSSSLFVSEKKVKKQQTREEEKFSLKEKERKD
tara:strand:- start:324 stop:449 length:126 start_codon:yes stop_codon:yes gene_type:complete